MKKAFLPIAALVGLLFAGDSSAQELLPKPQPLPEKVLKSEPAEAQPKVSPTAFQQELDRLKAARAALEAERQLLEKEFAPKTLSNKSELLKLKMRLGEILGKLTSDALRERPEKPKAPERPHNELPMPQPLPKEVKKDTQPPDKDHTSPAASENGKAAAPAELADLLFKQGQYAQALEAYRTLAASDLRPEDRRAVRFLMAMCLRKLGKADEARSIYREIANTPGDEILSQCAQWQLSTLNWRQNTAAQLEQLSKRIKALERGP